MASLDVKDRKILFELEQDSRLSFKQLGKKVTLSRETVFHRVKNLEKRGIIIEYITEINVYKLGYKFYPMLIRFQNTTPEIEKEVYTFLQNSSFVSWLSNCEGAWDINATLIAKNDFDLQTFLDEFLHKYAEFILEKSIFAITEIHYYKKAFWLEKQTMEITSTGGESVVSVDPLDLKLLKILSTDARKPFVEIAKELSTNPKKVASMIKRLEKENIIQGTRIRVDFSKIGYRFYKIFFSLKNLSPENYKKFMGYLHLHPQVIWTTRLIGYYDFSVELIVEGLGEFQKFLDEVKARFSHLIKKKESLLIFKESVMDYLPLT